MNLHRIAREWYKPDIQSTPELTNWEASFDGGADWVPGTLVGGELMWLVQGPDFDPADFPAPGVTSTTIVATTHPQIRAVDNTEVVVRRPPAVRLMGPAPIPQPELLVSLPAVVTEIKGVAADAQAAAEAAIGAVAAAGTATDANLADKVANGAATKAALDARSALLVSDGSADQAARINAFWQANKGKTIRMVGAFTHGATLYLPAGTTIDATAATITAKAGWNGYPVQAECQQTAIKSPPLTVASAVGGTLAAGTYSYQVSATTASGETVGSMSRSITLGATGSVKLTWTAPTVPAGGQAITGYRIWGRSGVAGTERTLLAAVSAAALTWTDDGSATPGGEFPPAVNSTFGRTAGISVIGGTWDGNGANRTGSGNWVDSGSYAGHVFDLQHVDQTSLVGLTVVGGIKWAIAVADFTDLTTRDITFNTGADGIHVLGPGNGWYGSNIHGHTGDDLVGMSLVEWPGYAVCEGNVSNVSVRDIRGTDSPSAVRMLMGTRRAFRNIVIGDVTGDYTKYRDATTQAYTTAAVGVVFLDNEEQDVTRRGGTASQITFDKIRPTSQQCPAIRVGGSISDILLSDVRSGTAGQRAIYVVTPSGGGTLGTIDVRRVYAKDINAIHTDTVTVAKLSVADPVVESSASADIGALRCFGSTIPDIAVSNPQIAALASTVIYLETGTYSKVLVTSGNMAGGQAVVKSKVPATVTLRDVATTGLTSGALALFTAAASPVTYESSGMVLTSSAGLSKDTTQTVNTKALTTVCDVSKATKTANNMAYNTNAGLSCGVGPVVCDGTSWKHLFTGATY